MKVIQVSELTKKFGTKNAVEAINFTVEEGQIFGFLGPNGSGKTTTIGMILGIINPTGGSIELFESHDLQEGRREIGATLETPNFYPYLSGRDNLRVVAKIKDADEKEIDRVLDIVELTNRQKDRFQTYSLGMKQRLAIAGAMLNDPRLIILDEPTNGLDPEGIRDVRQIMKRLNNEGKTIFLSSHLLAEVEQVCTHVAVIKQGKLLRQSSIREIVSQNLFAFITADNRDSLKGVLSSYAKVVSVAEEQDGLLVELTAQSEEISHTKEWAELNRFLGENKIYLSTLAPRRQSLEEAFIEITK
ncbi:MAG: ABC transporter ATP-binding protein [Chloroherpetonaceae bacterium]|nr:ABC transporter ATP-binding protein [Chloroherpetonaceae bacterium]